MDACITQLKAQGPSRTCNESNKEEEGVHRRADLADDVQDHVLRGTKAGSYLRLIDSCTNQLKAQGSSRTCKESKEEEGEEGYRRADLADDVQDDILRGQLRNNHFT